MFLELLDNRIMHTILEILYKGVERMFFSLVKQKKVIMDFQLIYDTDSYIQLDFYAQGLKQEPLLYNRPIYLERKSYGFLTGDLNMHKDNEDVFHEHLQKEEWVHATAKQMIQSIRQLHYMTRKIEASLKNNVLSYELWNDYFQTIARVLSFKRFSDECKAEDFCHDTSIFEEQVKQLRLPSHILLFHQKFERLRKDYSPETIQEFIHRYGFLYDFNIEETIFENQEAILEKLKQPISKKVLRSPSKKVIQMDDSSLRLFKSIVWYEELRHYYQARAVRNYRVALEILGLNIYQTGIDTFHKNLKKEVSHDTYNNK